MIFYPSVFFGGGGGRESLHFPVFPFSLWPVLFLLIFHRFPLIHVILSFSFNVDILYWKLYSIFFSCYSPSLLYLSMCCYSSFTIFPSFLLSVKSSKFFMPWFCVDGIWLFLFHNIDPPSSSSSHIYHLCPISPFLWFPLTPASLCFPSTSVVIFRTFCFFLFSSLSSYASSITATATETTEIIAAIVSALQYINFCISHHQIHTIVNESSTSSPLLSSRYSCLHSSPKLTLVIIYNDYN